MSLWHLPDPLVLASKSASRRDLLIAAGIPLDIRPADLDERALDAPDGAALATALAAAKARAVATNLPGRLVLGADQTMSLTTGPVPRVLHKAKDRAEARQILALLRGQTHVLHSATALVRDGIVLWSTLAEARLTMRAFDDRFLDLYLEAAGADVTDTVGCYRLEGVGCHLFERVDGDHSTILGLPILPLLDALRVLGALAT